ncbi:hypothetical protein VTO42DRAFT_8633 [Malbranchea cinnamomea]
MRLTMMMMMMLLLRLDWIAEDEYKELCAKIAVADNDAAAATAALEYLSVYGSTMDARQVTLSNVQEFLDLYRSRRAELSAQYHQAIVLRNEVMEKAEKSQKKGLRLSRAYGKAKTAATKAKRDNREKKHRARVLSQLVLHLDGLGEASPASSRRNSVSSTKKQEIKDDLPTSDVASFTVTYVTSKATWTPRYELFLETPSASGKVAYRAEYHNWSSETWRDTKVILSNSQTSSSGMNEKIPSLQAWNVKFLKTPPWQDQTLLLTGKMGLISNQGASLEASHTAPAARDGLFGSASNQGGLFGASQTAPVTSGGLFGGAGAPQAKPEALEHTAAGYSEAADEGHDSDGTDNAILSDVSNIIAFQESSRHDYGFTTCYEIPGRRSLPPSSLKRRYVIQELDIASITFSHVVVPKLRPTASLKARFVNSSSTTFLRGRAGLGLDGTFLGTTTVPDCPPNAALNLSLGVDPRVQVNYAEPSVRRATTGFFNREDCAIFTRVCRLTNAKSTAVSVEVLDQVPVSEDERLRIRILEPFGLEKEGDSMKVGSEASKRAWGKGAVTLDKDGEIKWQLTLEKGAEFKLTLEYEARIPTGQKIVGLA